MATATPRDYRRPGIGPLSFPRGGGAALGAGTGPPSPHDHRRACPGRAELPACAAMIIGRCRLRRTNVPAGHGQCPSSAAGLFGKVVRGAVLRVIASGGWHAAGYDVMPEDHLDDLLTGEGEVIFARASPEASRRTATTLVVITSFTVALIKITSYPALSPARPGLPAPGTNGPGQEAKRRQNQPHPAPAATGPLGPGVSQAPGHRGDVTNVPRPGALRLCTTPSAECKCSVTSGEHPGGDRS